MAERSGLRLMLDIAPGHVAADSVLLRRYPDWFLPVGQRQFADPRRQPHRIDVAVTRFSESGVADAVSDWWIELLTRFTQAGIAGFRCLTLDIVPAAFWRRLTTTFPDSLFLAWTPGVANLRDFVGAGFDLTCSSAGWWDGRASWFLDEQVALREIAPAVATPEPSFLNRLIPLLAPDADVAVAYRLALSIAASTGSGLFLPMGFEYATSRRFDPVRASPADMAAAERDGGADLSEDIAAAIRLIADLPPADRLRRITSPAASVTALLRSGVVVVINPDIIRPAALGFALDPLPSMSGRALAAEGDVATSLQPGEVRVLRCRETRDIQGGGIELARPWAEATRIAVEAVEPGGEFPAKMVVGRAFAVQADVFGDGHDVLAADLLWRPPIPATGRVFR